MTERGAEILQWLAGALRRLELVSADTGLEAETGLIGEGIGLDSVEALQLVTEIENHFDLILEDSELSPDHFRSVGALCAFVEAKLET